MSAGRVPGRVLPGPGLRLTAIPWRYVAVP
jgi:hypothetical protein